MKVLQQPSNEQRICLERGRLVLAERSRLSPSAIRLCVWSPRQPGEESERGDAVNNPAARVSPASIKANHWLLTETCNQNKTQR